MKFEHEEMCVDEIEISVKNILAQCIKKAGVILISMIFVAILLPALFYVMDLKQYNEAVLNSATETELSDEDYLIIDRYLLTKERIEFLEEHKEASRIYDMDFNNVYQGKVQFFVDANSEDTIAIADAIANYVRNKAFSEQLSQQVASINEKYAYELVSVSDSVTETGIVNVSIYAPDEKECKEIVNAIKNVLNEYSILLNSTMGAHELCVVGENYYVGYVDDVYRMQSNYIVNMQTAMAELETYNSTLTATQKKAIAQILDDMVEVDEVPKPQFKILYAAIGGVAGLILGCGMVIVLTVFTGKLQSEKELTKRLNIEYLGSVRLGKKGRKEKFIDKYIYKSDSYEKEVGAIVARIKMKMKECSTNTINMINVCDTSNSGAMDEIKRMLEENGITCEIIGNVVEDVVALSKLDDRNDLILVEKIGKSRVKDIYEEATICLNLNVTVVGYISVRE